MALYYITGQAGTGKSSVCLELRERGYRAYDGDDDGLARWIHIETGYVHPKSSIKAHQRTHEFLANHEWIIPRSTVEELALEGSHKPVFLCGVAGNETAIHDLFKKTFALILDATNTAKRLQERETNDWGKRPDELAYTLSLLDPAIARYQEMGHTFIDAAQPLDKVVDYIVSSVTT